MYIIYFFYVFLLPWDKDQKQNAKFECAESQMYSDSRSNVPYQGLLIIQMLSNYLYIYIYNAAKVRNGVRESFACLFSEDDGFHKPEFWSTLTTVRYQKMHK